MAKNYYDILGIPKNATKDEIKKAYRKLAHQHHPDKQGGDEAKFKEVNEAYQVLGDDQKRSKYDQFGTGFNDNAGGFGGGGPFGGQGFGDFDFGGFSGGFEDIFDMFGMGGKGKTRARRGQDIKVDFGIDLEDSVNGGESDVNFRKLSLCKKCDGKGGFDPENCARCSGTGQVKQTMNTMFGAFAQVVACPKCHGKGKSFKRTCNDCHGEGRHQENVSFKIKIPKGILDGEIIKFIGEGEAGTNGAPAGDMFVQIHFNPHKNFKHKGVDIYYDLSIDMIQAALGDKIEIPTLYGDVSLKLDGGTQPGDIIKISGKGLPKRSSWGGKGDMYVKVKVGIPKNLTKKQKELLEEFKKEK